jgi:glycosyltransferase involved in cell wall biosynthesis
MCEQMLREAKTFRPDVILAFYLLNAGFLSRFISAELELPYVVSVRGNDIGMDAFNADRFSIVQWTLEGAARIVVVNPFLKRRVLAVSPHLAPRTLVISNGVEFGTLLESKDQSRGRLRAATSWDDDQLVVVFVGTLREKKGVVPLLAAIEKVAGQSPIKLLVVGPTIGSLEQQLCGDVWNRLQERGIIHCTGQLARADVPLWTAGGDIIVMPSLDDGLANALLEGMSLGLCPVASRVFADVIIDGENGFLFDSADHGQLAAILKRLADENRTVARGVGRAASDHVRRHHTPTDEAMQYLAVLASVVSGVSCT